MSELREGVLGVRPLERRGEGSVSRDLQVDPGETRPGPEPRWGRDGTGPASDTDQAGGSRALAPGSNAHANYCGPFAGTIQELMMCRQGRLRAPDFNQRNSGNTTELGDFLLVRAEFWQHVSKSPPKQSKFPPKQSNFPPKQSNFSPKQSNFSPELADFPAQPADFAALPSLFPAKQ